MAEAYPVNQPRSQKRDFSPFALLKVTVSDFLPRDQLELLAELFQLNSGEREQFNNSTAPPGLAFIRILEQKCYFTNTDVDRFINGLQRIGHLQLAEIVEQYKKDHIHPATNVSGNYPPYGHIGVNSGQTRRRSPALHPTYGNEVLRPGQDAPADQNGGDQIVIFPVDERDNYPNCVLSIDVSSDAVASHTQRNCSSFLGKLKNHILTTAPSGYIDHLSDIFIFFRRLYGDLVKITFGSIQLHVRVPNLAALDRLQKDCESGYIKDELTALLLPEHVQTQMNRKGLYLTFHLDFESVRKVRQHVISGILDLDPEGIQGMPLFCDYCKVIFAEKWEHEEHIKSQEHHNKIATKQGSEEWHHREPPSAVTNGNFKICRIQDCRFFQKGEGENHCEFAHTEDELHEWRKRHAHRLKDIQSIRNQTLSSPREKGRAKKSRRWSEEIAKVNKAENLETVGPITYNEDCKIADGSFASEVFVGSYKNEDVAVKRVPTSAIQKEHELYKRMKDMEVSNVLEMLHIEKGKYVTHIVTNLCEYNLSEIIENRDTFMGGPTLSTEKRVFICVEILTGLKHLHSMGIVHRDLKPRNILLDVNGTTYVADFGTSRNVRGETTRFTTAMGTECWMASENCGVKEIKNLKASDVQVAGFLIYYVLSDGHHPFENTFPYTEDDVFKLIERIKNGDFSLQHVKDYYPEQCISLLQRMLHKNPSSRPKIGECLEVMTAVESSLYSSSSQTVITTNENIILSMPGVKVICATPFRKYLPGKTQKSKEERHQWRIRITCGQEKLKKVYLWSMQQEHFYLSDPPRQSQPQECPASQLQEDPRGGFTFNVYFTSKKQGCFHEWLMFNFGEKNLCQQVIVWVGPEFANHFPQVDDPSIPWNLGNHNVIKYPLPPDTFYDSLKEKKEYHLPEELPESSELEWPSRENFREYFHRMVYTEEWACIDKLKKYNGKLTMKLKDSVSNKQGLFMSPEDQLFGEIHLKVPLDDSEASQVVHKRVHIILLKFDLSGDVFEAKIVDENILDLREVDCFYVNLSADCVRDQKMKAGTLVEVDVQFQVDRKMFCNFHFAIDMLRTKELLFPPGNMFPRFLEEESAPVAENTSDLCLNHRQEEAKKFIMRAKDIIPFRQGPSLIIGPFGTGKTQTLARTVEDVLELDASSRILICTHSNSAADDFITKHLQVFLEKRQHVRVLRQYATERNPDHIPDAIKKYCCIRQSQGTTKFVKPDARLVNGYRVVVTTLATSIHLVDILQLRGHFTHIFIDEAGQALETETMIPLGLAGPRTVVVLAGDHKQMRPKVFSEMARKSGFKQSMLERLFYWGKDHKCNNTHFLTDNYRMRQEILDFIGKHCYQVENFSSKVKEVPQTSFYPIAFSAVKGEEKLEGIFYMNEKEATEIVKQIKELQSYWPREWGKFSEDKIVVLTPYKLQVKHMKQLLKKERLQEIPVDTIQNVQGRQFQVVFISPVRTVQTASKGDYFGVLSDEGELITAFTRAKSYLFVVGDPVSLCSVGECKEIWKKYLQVCEQHKSLKPSDVSYKLIEESIAKIQSDQDISAPETEPPSAISEHLSNLVQQPEQQQEILSSSGSQDYDTDVEFEEKDEDDLVDEIIKEMNIQVEKEHRREESEFASAPHQTEPSSEPSEEETVEQLPTQSKSRRKKHKRIKFRVLQGEEMLRVVGIKDSLDRSKLEGGYDPEDVEEGPEDMGDEEKDMYIQKTKDDPDRYCICVVRFAENYLVHAVPLSNHPANKIKISHKTKRKRALDGDQVVVKTWRRRDDVTYGEVMCILKRADELRWKRIVCTLDSEGLMCPVGNSLLPKMFIFPKGAKKETGSQDINFGLYSIKPKGEKKIKHVKDVLVKFKEMGQKLFVVQYSQWFPNCPYPMGIVTQELPPCDTLKAGLHILQLIHGVKVKWSQSLCDHITQQFPEPWEIPKEEIRKRKKYDFRQKSVFTIGKSDFRDCDHAMHIEELEDGRVMLGLHLADVGFFVEKDSDVDKEALRRGSSFHATFSNPSHMLPQVLSTQLCKFNVNHDQLSVSILLTFNQSRTSVENSVICRSIVCCKQNLMFENVENFLLNNFDEHFEFKPEVMQQVEMLYKVTASIPQPQVICAEIDDQVNFPLAYDLVEGVRKLVTIEVVKKLNFGSPGQIPVCRQLPPQQKDLEDWHKIYDKDVCAIPHLPISVALNRENTDSTAEMLPVLQTTWKEIEQALKSGRDNVLQLKRILKCKDGHPKQAVALAQLDTIIPAEEIICVGGDIQGHQHFSLQEDHVHPFMAPTRSYMDLIVLRMLVACQEKAVNPYSEDDLSHIAYHCTKQTQSARRFEKNVQRFVFALKLKSVPHQLNALVQTASKEELVFSYPFTGFLKISHSSTHVPLRLLKPGTQPQSVEDEIRSIELNWRNRIYNYKCIAPVIRNNKSVFCLFTDIHVQNMPVSFLEDIQETVEQKKYDHLELLEVDWNKIESRESERSTLPEDGRSELVREISCERMNTNEGFSELRKYIEFKRQFNPGHVVELQLCAGLEQGILGPVVQLFKLTPKFDLCLEHRGMPVECFTEVAEKLPAKCETVSGYVKVWLPLLRMMVAYNTIMNDETILIQDVNVNWSKEDVGFSKEAVYGHFSLDMVWCDDRQISFGTRPKKKKDIRGFLDPTEKFLVSDYICVRLHGYEINEDQQFQLEKLGSKCRDVCLKTDVPTPKMSTLVVHGVAGTTNIGNKANVKEYDVEFQVTHTSCEIPKHLFDDGESSKVQCTVELIPKSEPEKRMEAALANIELSGPLIINIVLQNPEKMLESKSEILEKLIKEGSKFEDRSFRSFFGKQPPNRSQSEALRKALSQPFTVIQGPPGTGKTRTGAYLTSFFAQINKKVFPRTIRSQILYCGPSNKSVDVITEYLQKFENKKLKFVRVYSDTIEQQTYKVPGVESAERKFGYVENIQMSEEVKKHALHHIIRSDEAGGDGKKIKQMDAQFRDGMLEPTLRNVREYKELVKNTKLAILRKRDIILCTCNAAGHYLFKDNLNIVQCIIDEAGMCFELDTLIPLVTQKPKQVVLIGDHKQLRPIIQDPRAKQLGAEISMMEKFQGIAYTLTIQYRMHEEICKFPSKEFYNSKLETDESVKRRGQVLPPQIWPGTDHHPRVFCHIEGKEVAQTVRTAEGNEMSRENEEEADEVVRIASTLVEKFAVEPENLIILSQYRLQCLLIKNKLKRESNSKPHLKDVKIQTIIRSQGSEWDFVILSTVRSLPEEDIPESPGKSWKRQNLGFIEDENQMNVGLTRAKRGLIIIGNKHLLNTCSKWRELIKHYDETNSVVEASEFPN